MLQFGRQKKRKIERNICAQFINMLLFAQLILTLCRRHFRLILTAIHRFIFGTLKTVNLQDIRQLINEKTSSLTDNLSFFEESRKQYLSNKRKACTTYANA